MAYIGKQPTVGNFVKLDAITTSATTTFNLLNGGTAYYPQSANNCIVSLNGVIQSPTSAYTISGSTIVFSDALTSSDVIDFILVLGDVLNIGTPSDSTVSFAKVTSNLITGATAETSIDGADSLLIYDDSASALRKMTRTNFVSGLATTNGISQADVMRLIGSQNITAGVYTTLTPFARANEATYDKIGTGMTQSSGIFTFPATGIYLVSLLMNISDDADVTYTITQIQGTSNNSTYATIGESNFSIKLVSGRTYYTTNSFCFFDVQSTANYKVRFQVYGTHDFRVDGQANFNTTSAYFIKLGET